MEKLHSYQGWIGRFHELRESFRERFTNWRQENPETFIELVKKKIYDESSNRNEDDYSHLHRSLFICAGFFFLFRSNLILIIANGLLCTIVSFGI